LRTLLLVLAVVTVGLTTAPAIAQQDATAGLVRIKLEELAEAHGDPDLADAVKTGRLKMDSEASHSFRLDPAKSYLVLAACEELCSHLDLVASDAGNGAIVEDDDRDKRDEPVLELAGGEVSRLSIKVEMSGCEKASPCVYALGLYELP
jgi:hypothetical protein